jgi:Family of unknown function (DUF5946)
MRKEAQSSKRSEYVPVMTQTKCSGCGAVVPDIDGPVHNYVPSAPGCWQTFGEVQADEAQRLGYPAVHRVVVDAYMAQHPGDGSDRRDRQSVFVHLAGLCAVLEHDLPHPYVGGMRPNILVATSLPLALRLGPGSSLPVSTSSSRAPSARRRMSTTPTRSYCSSSPGRPRCAVRKGRSSCRLAR